MRLADEKQHVKATFKVDSFESALKGSVVFLNITNTTTDEMKKAGEALFFYQYETSYSM